MGRFGNICNFYDGFMNYLRLIFGFIFDIICKNG